MDLAAIRERGVLRVLTRNNAQSYFVWRGEPMGFDYELAKRLAERLGVKPKIIVPERWENLIPELRQGNGDLIAASMTVTPSREEQVLFADPYKEIHQIVVWAEGTEPLNSALDLAGRTVHVRRSSAYYPSLLKLNERLDKEGLDKAQIHLVPEEQETEEILEAIARGDLTYTIADENLALVNRTYLPNLEIGPPITEKPTPLAWAVNPNASRLAAEINAFLSELKRGPIFNVIYRRYYDQPRTHARRKQDDLFAQSGQISPWDEIFQRAAEKYGFDWRLLAAQAYQESRFQPDARSFAGALGVLQIMPRTARALGIENPIDPAQSIMGGARYLARLQKRFAEISDSTARLKFALASYNCGFTHVRNARKLAKRLKLSPDRWEENVAAALHKLSSGRYARKQGFSYVRASEPIRYVREIFQTYWAYRHATGERD